VAHLPRKQRHEPYDVVIALTYYSPYVSGLTETARAVAEGLAERGWRIAVVCARHSGALPGVETVNGVDVYRAKVLLRLGKGVISPGFALHTLWLGRRARLVNLHAPLLETGFITRLLGATPLVITYACDVVLPSSAINRLVMRLMDSSHRRALRRADVKMVSSRQYAATSRLSDSLLPDAVEFTPPCHERRGGSATFRETPGLHIGFLGRIVEEKGLEYLVEAFRQIPDEDARLLIGGPFEGVAGGSCVHRVRAAGKGDPRIRLLGWIPDDRMADFYASMDVFVFPSVNALEAFGIAQVEALLVGVPVVATDLPGVRVPVETTGFGQIVPSRDAEALTKAICYVARHEDSWEEGAARAHELYSIERTIDDFVRAFCATKAAPLLPRLP
jgi:glycosyltransferase involved in cell wall biosynthesis